MTLFSGGFPLFCQVQEPDTLNAALNLTAFASVNESGKYTSITLFAESSEEANQASGQFSLWANAVPDGPLTAAATLFAQGRSYQISSSLNLFAENTGQAAALNLYASGQGWTAGATPFSASMPLHVDRDEVATMTLYCCVGTPAQSGMNLYALGSYEQTASMDLVVPSSVGLSTSSLNIYAGGY